MTNVCLLGTSLFIEELVNNGKQSIKGRYMLQTRLSNINPSGNLII